MCLITEPTYELWRENVGITGSEPMFISEILMNPPYVLCALRLTISIDIFLSLKVKYGK